MKHRLASKAHLWPLMGQFLLYYKSDKTPVTGRQGDDSVGEELVRKPEDTSLNAHGPCKILTWQHMHVIQFQNPRGQIGGIDRLPRSQSVHPVTNCKSARLTQGESRALAHKFTLTSTCVPTQKCNRHAVIYFLKSRSKILKERGAGWDNQISVGPSILKRYLQVTHQWHTPHRVLRCYFKNSKTSIQSKKFHFT